MSLIDDPLAVDNPIIKEIETCPNSNCLLTGKKNEGNIVCDGTYRTKQGTLRRRFLCKKCGEYFTSNAGTIFYGLRSPKHKVLTAITHLVREISLRGVAKIMGVKFDTVRPAFLDSKAEAILLLFLKLPEEHSSGVEW